MQTISKVNKYNRANPVIMWFVKHQPTGNHKSEIKHPKS